MAEAGSARLILASGSPYRRKMLEEAGLSFAVVPARIDERGLENDLKSRAKAVGASDIAAELALAKALAVNSQYPGAMVIGCDQVLGFEGALLAKAESRHAARAQLLGLRGKTHTLHSAVVLARGGQAVWQHVDIACMTMRAFSQGFLDGYLEEMGDRVCQTVGGYEIEGRGIQLFDRVEGDYFTIIGLPLLALLAKLRDLGVIAT